MSEIKFKTQYDVMCEKKGITFSEPSRTKQDYKDECNINCIIRRYEATGIVNHVSQYQPVYADLSQVGDLSEAYALIDRANESFAALPSELREELNHDPRNLVPFISNPANKEKCYQYGIFNRPVEVPKARNVVPDNSVKESAQSST